MDWIGGAREFVSQEGRKSRFGFDREFFGDSATPAVKRRGAKNRTVRVETPQSAGRAKRGKQTFLIHTPLFISVLFSPPSTAAAATVSAIILATFAIVIIIIIIAIIITTPLILS